MRRELEDAIQLQRKLFRPAETSWDDTLQNHAISIIFLGTLVNGPPYLEPNPAPNGPIPQDITKTILPLPPPPAPTTHPLHPPLPHNPNANILPLLRQHPLPHPHPPLLLPLSRRQPLGPKHPRLPHLPLPIPHPTHLFRAQGDEAEGGRGRHGWEGGVGECRSGGW